jgi:2-oxoisovalerate dehydrogenase E1 component beta subunit
MASMTVIEAVRSTLDEALGKDERVFILGEDVEAGGVFRVTEGLAAKHPGRVIDSPLAESSIIGLSIGAAHYGMRPVAEIQFADFIHAGFDQLCSEASRWCYRTRGDAYLPMVVRTPWGGGVHGGQHHSQSIEAYYAHMPGIKVVAPAFPADYRSLLRAAIEDPNPVLFLEHKRTYRLIRQEVEGAPAETVIGRARVTRTGADLTIMAYGLMLHESLAAAETLAREGIEATVVDLLTLNPIDREGDRKGPDRARRHADRGPGRRNRGNDRRARLRIPRRADPAGSRAGHPIDAVSPRHGGLLHAEPGEDRGGSAGTGGILMNTALKGLPLVNTEAQRSPKKAGASMVWGAGGMA